MAESVVVFVQKHGDCNSENTDAAKEAKLQSIKNNKLRKSRSFGNIMSVGSRLDPNNSQERNHPQTVPEAYSQPSTPDYNVIPSIQYSPSHSVLTKCDKVSLKHLSTSTPVMTAQAQLDEPPSPKTPNDPKIHITSKARQKKFMRHFPAIEEDEQLLNHYSCALVGDILFQGHLYITTNYFAFYSNVFGYVTKVLIPVLTVEDITKEKTARIIPNAVGVVTADDKHIFGSLMSRDNTLRYMKTVWQRAKNASPVIIEPEIEDQEIDSSDSIYGESGRDSPSPEIKPKFSLVKNLVNERTEALQFEMKPSGGLLHNLKETLFEFQKLSRKRIVFNITMLILIVLCISAAALVYRISIVKSRNPFTLQPSFTKDSRNVYSDILQYHNQMRSKSAGAVHDHLDSNLDIIAQVRKSLESLSTLLLEDYQSYSKQEATPKPLEVTKGQS